MEKETMAMLLADGYKHCHAEQYPKGLTLLVSYMTPRKSRLAGQDTMVFFGLQAFCKQYLIQYFNENFFQKDCDEVVKEYRHILDPMLGAGNYGLDKIRELHKLGYLPLLIDAVPEGTEVPMHVPCLRITNTHEDFAWVVQWVESLLSAELWKPCVHAGVGKSYRKIVDKYYELTVDDPEPWRAMSDFGFRGMSCLQEAVKASAAWLLSFTGTATIPAIPYLERYYYCNNEETQFASNAISTEHSVMACNFAVDGDEVTMIKRLLTEVYPNASFSMVSDTYDFWNLVDNLLPQCREEILNHNGKILIRPDSGDIVDISVKTVQHLYGQFPGPTNSKGYKTLDPHVGVVYGDSVTQKRAEKIYQALMENGFAANCIVFGAGSFSFHCLEEDGKLNPYTRDTFSVAVKATYGIVDGKEVKIFKDPKTDKVEGQNFKKSQKGLVFVETRDGKLSAVDDMDMDEYTIISATGRSAFHGVFRDGKMRCEDSLHDIRTRMYGEDF